MKCIARLETFNLVPTAEDIEKVLYGWKGNNNAKRKQASGGEIVESDTFGLVRDLSVPAPSGGVNMWLYPHLTCLLNWWARENCLPCFTWSTFTINNNWAASAHGDRNNTGSSLILSVGNHRGGRLLTYIDDKENDNVLVQDPHRKAVFFDGQKLHKTEDFEGDRTSII